MAEYLLPCNCGRQIAVSTAQAGDTARCECGAEVPVPTLRDMRELEPASTSTTARRPAWDDRHRVGFLLALGAISCLFVAGYLWSSLPVSQAQPTSEQFTTAVESFPASELMELHKQATHGLAGFPADDGTEQKIRQMMQWGIGIVLVLAVAASASACIVIWNRPEARK
jgi:hypothetical protein